MGIVVVAALAATAEVSPPVVTITATCRWTRSSASACTRSYWPSAQRYSMTTLWPSRYPTSCKPRRKPAMRCAKGAGRRRAEEADHRHRRLLRARRQRPRRRRAAEQRDELAPAPHSITSSARASSVGGILRPSALGGLQVDDEIELGRLFDRQVGWLCRRVESCRHSRQRADADPEIWSVGYQAAGLDVFAIADTWWAIARPPPKWRLGSGWWLRADRRRHKVLRPCPGAPRWQARYPRCGGFPMLRLLGRVRAQPLHLTDVQNYRGIVNVGHDRQMAETGDNFAQEFETLASKIGRLVRQTGDIAARPRQTGDQPVSNRISRYREDDRDDRCRLLCCEDRWSALRYNRHRP